MFVCAAASTSAIIEFPLLSNFGLVRPMLFTFCRYCFVLLATSLMCVAHVKSVPAADSLPGSTASKSEELPANVKGLVRHGRLLSHPATQPEGTQGAVSYELGRILQLDRDHCLLVASMDEQGGGDLCVGNDGFVIQKLADVAAEKAIPLNRALKDYRVTPDAEKTFLAKYPAVGEFVPLGARLANGKANPAAGTGVLLSCASTYQTDKTEGDKSVRMVEVIQLRWDGTNLKVVSREIVSQLLALKLNGSTPLGSCAQDDGLLLPFGTVEDGMVVYRFDWNGKEWKPTKHGKPFAKSKTELETSLRRQDDTYYIQTRCRSAEGNLYRSKDGLEFEFAATLDSHAGSPKVLNQGLDGSLYVACNSSPGWVRNPLEAVPWEKDHFGKPFTLHDQDGVRGDKGSSKPFVDHAVASNVLLEGRWRHIVLYRVCDLMERTLHDFQLKEGFGDVVYGKGKGPIPRRPWSGMYAVELEYDKVTAKPYQFE
jgi:hypothetical protein